MMHLPIVTINDPTTSGAYVTMASNLTFRGLASDNTGVTLVTVTNDRGGVGTVRGISHWSAWVELWPGRNVFTVTARDAAGNTSTAVLVVNRSVAPVLAIIGSWTTTRGQAVSLQLSATDANGDQLTYSATGLPPGLSVNAQTGLISGTPTTAGTYPVTATVSDGTYSHSRTFTWTIRP